MKTDTVESGTGGRMSAVRADFKTHRDHRWGALMLPPVFRKLLLEMLQEVDLIRVDTPGLAVPHGNILYVRVPALHTDISRTVLRRDTGV